MEVKEKEGEKGIEEEIIEEVEVEVQVEGDIGIGIIIIEGGLGLKKLMFVIIVEKKAIGQMNALFRERKGKFL